MTGGILTTALAAVRAWLLPGEVGGQRPVRTGVDGASIRFTPNVAWLVVAAGYGIPETRLRSHWHRQHRDLSAAGQP